MHLLNLTLSATSAVNGAAVGQFSGTRTQEVVLAKATRIHLLRPDTQSGKLVTICEQEAFGVIRSIIPFRLIGGTKGEWENVDGSVRELGSDWCGMLPSQTTWLSARIPDGS